MPCTAIWGYPRLGTRRSPMTPLSRVAPGQNGHLTYRTHNDAPLNADGTSLCGFLDDVAYAELVARFGAPRPRSADGKVSASWTIQFAGGPLVTIYAWRTYVPPEGVRKWNVGGRGDGKRISQYLERVGLKMRPC